MCCPDITTTTTTSTTHTTTPPSATDNIDNVIEHKNETIGSDVVQAEPSQIDEVVVKITGEVVEVKQISSVRMS